MTATVDASCPQCRVSLVSLGSAPGWCPDCEWGLDHHDAQRRPELAWKWADRLSYRLAYKLTVGRHTDLSRDPSRPLPGAAATRTLLIAVAVLLLTATAALFAAGVYLLVAYFFSLLTVVGAILVLLAVTLRPRLGRMEEDVDRLDEASAPTLFRLIAQVAAATSAPVPHVVEVDDEFNASYAELGVRRRRVLRLGLPLWAVLTPQQRVALLGHELGHFVNGDLRRGLLTGVPLTTTAALLDLLAPDPRRAYRQAGFLVLIASALTNVIVGVLRTVAAAVYLALLWCVLREGQHAEYLADDLAARAGGSRAAAELCDLFVSTDSATMLIARDARAGLGPQGWRATIAGLRQETAQRRSLLRQRSIRAEVSMFASHPPSGLRARLIEARAGHPAAVVLTETENARIDAELAQLYAATRRNLAAG